MTLEQLEKYLTEARMGLKVEEITLEDVENIVFNWKKGDKMSTKEIFGEIFGEPRPTTQQLLDKSVEKRKFANYLLDKANELLEEADMFLEKAKKNIDE